MRLFFNELSVRTEELDVYSVRTVIEQFIITYNEAVKKYGFERAITTCEDFNNIMLAKDYPISKWRNDAGVDRDLARRYRGICDKQNVEALLEDEIEISCDKGNGRGLLAAWENNGVSISFANDEFWKNAKIDCRLCMIDEDEVSTVQVLNIAEKQQLVENGDLIQNLKKSEVQNITTPKQLLASLDSLYPSLVFNKVALEQLKNLVETKHVCAICNKLYMLENYFADWTGGVFDESAFPTKSVSPQSKETLKRFKEEHTFQFEDKQVIVSYHMRYTGGIPGRIYFHPDSQTGKGLVCSLTTKLPTVTEPTMHI